MQFNGSGMGRGNKIQSKEIKLAAAANGYSKIPTIIFWNLSTPSVRGVGPKVAAADENGVICISGFSTKIMKAISAIIAGEEMVSTDTVMLEVLLSERYNYC